MARNEKRHDEQITDPAPLHRDYRTKGPVYHYVTRGDEKDVVAPKMIVRYAQGEPLETRLARAYSECEGYLRT